MKKNNLMQPVDITELQARKKALKQEMEQIQSEIETSLSEVQDSVTGRTSIRYWVKKYPLQIAGTAVITGFLLARRLGRSNTAGASEGRGSHFTGLLLDEFKNLATRRAVDYVVYRIEEAIENRRLKTE